MNALEAPSSDNTVHEFEALPPLCQRWDKHLQRAKMQPSHPSISIIIIIIISVSSYILHTIFAWLGCELTVMVWWCNTLGDTLRDVHHMVVWSLHLSVRISSPHVLILHFLSDSFLLSDWKLKAPLITSYSSCPIILPGETSFKLVSCCFLGWSHNRKQWHISVKSKSGWTRS